MNGRSQGETQPGSQMLCLETNEVRPCTSVRLSNTMDSLFPKTMGPINMTHHLLLCKPHGAAPGLCHVLSTDPPPPAIAELTLMLFCFSSGVTLAVSSISLWVRWWLCLELAQSFSLLKWLCAFAHVLCGCDIFDPPVSQSFTLHHAPTFLPLLI